MAQLSRKFRQREDSRSLLQLWQVLHCPYTFAVSAAQNPDAITFRGPGAAEDGNRLRGARASALDLTRVT